MHNERWGPTLTWIPAPRSGRAPIVGKVIFWYVNQAAHLKVTETEWITIFCYLSLLQMLFKIPKGTANKLLSTCKGSITAQGPSSSCMLVAQAVLTEMWNSSIWLKVLQFSTTAQHSFLTPPHLCTQQANPGQHHKARSRWGCWRRAQHKRIQRSTYAQLCHIFTVEHNC